MSIQTINNIVEEYIMYLYTNFEPKPFVQQKLKLKVTRITIRGVEYFKDKQSNRLYNLTTKDCVGVWNALTKTIDDEEDISDDDDQYYNIKEDVFDYDYVINYLSVKYFKHIVCSETNLGRIITSYNIDKNSEEYKLFHFKMYYYNDYGSWYDDVEEKREELFSEDYRNSLNEEHDDSPYPFDDVVFNIRKYIQISCFEEHNQELKNFIREIVDSLDSPVILK